MKALRTLSVWICVVCYIFGSSVFSHVQSMNLLQPADTIMVMSDCGMMMEHPVDGELPEGDCFESCFGDYDDLWSNEIVVEDKVCAHRMYHSLHLDHTVGDVETCYLSQAPPDDRCSYKSVQTPYFSHTTTTKLE